MQSTIAFILIVLTSVFAFISWAITADMISFYRFYSNGSYFRYDFGYSYYGGYGSNGPLAVSAVELVMALLINFATAALAFYAWRERKNPGCAPRWLNPTVLGLCVVGFIIAIAQFGVFGHEGILVGEAAGQATMFFLATLLGIAATIMPSLPADWFNYAKKEQKEEVDTTAEKPAPAPRSADDLEAGRAAPEAGNTVAEARTAEVEAGATEVNAGNTAIETREAVPPVDLRPNAPTAAVAQTTQV
ncbi:conserved hypothetical Ustilago-specific protein [Sporisorium reilianum SRZ2]|uniref:Conserved hypothetical Ustilago-specific protein n=1 Tax=Sporisorium reilianum (strain SRZ2) TaxID=999809 RepID=E6ZSL2_SPORE|nr:conserved hypothetical Ustilago-specific protein [Sporisorium reilianum SRZ2]